MIKLLILLAFGAGIFWVVKTRKYAEALFVMAVLGGIAAFLKGTRLLDSYQLTDRWPGVALVLSSLILFLATGIVFKLLERQKALTPSTTKPLASTSEPGTAPQTNVAPLQDPN